MADVLPPPIPASKSCPVQGDLPYSVTCQPVPEWSTFAEYVAEETLLQWFLPFSRRQMPLTATVTGLPRYRVSFWAFSCVGNYEH